ncbi:MAG TPA: hypothetical protein RMH99_29665 [Sandaracinaceae bacterium LLY-WYZ-13_1]|nr:hypothetical protein [Sandaracinaceae bacterium LLY-WYZ-13_1]
MSEPFARRTIFAGFRKAALDRWGEGGLHAIAEAMSKECRRACIEPIVIGEPMLPERYVLEWYRAAYEGPARRDRAAYFGFIDRMMDHGFGRVRKLLLAMASPNLVARKAQELWRHDHTHGELALVESEPEGVVMRLCDHPYTETPLGRMSVAEIYRYAIALARARNVRSEHWLVAGALHVRIRWT